MRPPSRISQRVTSGPSLSPMRVRLLPQLDPDAMLHGGIIQVDLPVADDDRSARQGEDLLQGCLQQGCSPNLQMLAVGCRDATLGPGRWPAYGFAELRVLPGGMPMRCLAIHLSPDRDPGPDRTPGYVTAGGKGGRHNPHTPCRLCGLSAIWGGISSSPDLPVLAVSGSEVSGSSK
jgi:hypothetical protein